MNNFSYIPPESSFFKTNITTNTTKKTDLFIEKTYIQNMPSTNSKIKPNVSSEKNKKSSIVVTNWSIKIK